jgi:Transposase DDE domain group 1
MPPPTLPIALALVGRKLHEQRERREHLVSVFAKSPEVGELQLKGQKLAGAGQAQRGPAQAGRESPGQGTAPLPALPASKVTGADLADVVVLDVDATLATAHREKEDAAPTFKGGFGFHPIGVWCDNTTEFLAVALRPGNAGREHRDRPHRRP